MNYKTADRLNELFTLDDKYNIVLKDTKKILEDSMSKGYVYANMYFFDEVEKEVDKLREMVQKINDDLIAELGLTPDEPEKLLLELSVRVQNALGGDDSLDAVIKQMLSEKSKHMSLVPSEEEQKKAELIRHAIFSELCEAFYNMTFNASYDDRGKKAFRFSNDYITKMTPRQKKLLSPAIKMIAYQNQIKMNAFELTNEWSVRYLPERNSQPFSKQEDAIKEQIKSFVQANI